MHGQKKRANGFASPSVTAILSILIAGLVTIIAVTGISHFYGARGMLYLLVVYIVIALAISILAWIFA